MDAINIVEQGCLIKKSDIRFVIYTEGILKEYVSYFKINTIILWGSQKITTGALDLAFEKGIDVIFLTLGGKLKGKIESARSKNIYLRLAQYELWREKEEKLKFSKVVVKNKIKNQYMLLNYYGINCEELIDLAAKVDNVKENNEIMGFEGIASRIYFDKLKLILNGELKFEGRNRRPPKDEINAMLSLTYSMFLSKIFVELECRGIDSYLGFLHTIKYGREALGLDILEEFRQGICDHFVIKIIKRKEFKKADFKYSEENGMRFTDEAFRRYLIKYNKESEKWVQIIKEQIDKLRKSILFKIEYEPYEFSKRSNKN